ncbi:MAG: hypothetical protein ABI361_02040 [Nitrososphaera sp.]
MPSPAYWSTDEQDFFCRTCGRRCESDGSGLLECSNCGWTDVYTPRGGVAA